MLPEKIAPFFAYSDELLVACAPFAPLSDIVLASIVPVAPSSRSPSTVFCEMRDPFTMFTCDLLVA